MQIFVSMLASSQSAQTCFVPPTLARPDTALRKDRKDKAWPGGWGGEFDENLFGFLLRNPIVYVLCISIILRFRVFPFP